MNLTLSVAPEVNIARSTANHQSLTINTQLPTELFIQSLSFLGARDLVNAGNCSRTWRIASQCPEAQNLESIVELALQSGKPLQCIYRRDVQVDTPPGDEGEPLDEPLTIQKILGDYLIILPLPDSNFGLPHQLVIRGLQTGEEFSFDLDKRIESCHVVTHPELALVIANQEEGVKIVTLKQLLQQPRATSQFSELTSIDPAYENVNLLPILATEGSRIAIGYANRVELRDLCDNSLNILPFQEAQTIAIRDQDVLCVSRRECAVFSWNHNRESSPKIHVAATESESFKFAQFVSASEVAIARLWATDGLVATIHDLDTQQEIALFNSPSNRRPGLPILHSSLYAIIKEANHILGATSSGLLQWDVSPGSLPTPIRRFWNDFTAEYTIIKISSDCVLSASMNCAHLHPNLDFLKSVKSINRQLLDVCANGRNSKMHSLQIKGKYLVAEYAEPPESLTLTPKRNYWVKVFDLSQRPPIEPNESRL